MREKTIYEKIAEKYNTTPEEVRQRNADSHRCRI